MSRIKLSVIIPSYHDPYLIKTIKSLLDNSTLGEQLEIIPVFDGYWPEFDVIEDDHVRYVHLGSNRGMRGAINAGMRVARGEFVMRLDEHCHFAKGYDKELTDNCKSNWIVTAKRYFLDPVKWKLMDDPPVEIEKLVIQGSDHGRKFSGRPWKEKYGLPNPILEGFGMQGSMWVMPKKWWDQVIGELQIEGYGPTYQDSVEVCMKTWQAGGKLMFVRSTWYAHKHRSFPRTHNEGTKENPSNREASWKYALDVWEDYYHKEIEPKQA